MNFFENAITNWKVAISECKLRDVKVIDVCCEQWYLQILKIINSWASCIPDRDAKLEGGSAQECSPT